MSTSKKPQQTEQKGESQEKQKWRSNGPDRASLLPTFHKRLQHPDNHSAAEICDNFQCPFKGRHSWKNFGTCCQTAANGSKKFKKCGTSPGDFRKFAKQAQKDCNKLLNDKKVVFSDNKESKSKDNKDSEHKQQDSNNSGKKFSFESEENLTALMRDCDLDLCEVPKTAKKKDPPKKKDLLKTPPTTTEPKENKKPPPPTPMFVATTPKKKDEGGITCK